MRGPLYSLAVVTIVNLFTPVHARAYATNALPSSSDSTASRGITQGTSNSTLGVGPPGLDAVLDYSKYDSTLPDITLLSWLTLDSIKSLALGTYNRQIKASNFVSPGIANVAIIVRTRQPQLEARYLMAALQHCYYQVVGSIKERSLTPDCNFGLWYNEGTRTFQQDLGTMRFVISVAQSMEIGAQDQELSTPENGESNSSLPLGTDANGTSFGDPARYTATLTYYEGADPIPIQHLVFAFMDAMHDLAMRENTRPFPNPAEWRFSTQAHWLPGLSFLDLEVWPHELNAMRPRYEEYIQAFVVVFREMMRQPRYGPCSWEMGTVSPQKIILDGEIDLKWLSTSGEAQRGLGSANITEVAARS